MGRGPAPNAELGIRRGKWFLNSELGWYVAEEPKVFLNPGENVTDDKGREVVRSVAMNESLGRLADLTKAMQTFGGVANREFQIQKNSELFVFIDTDMASNPGTIFDWSTHNPAYLNGNNFSIGFADGHAESQHWNPDLSDQTILRNYLDRIGRLKGGTKILRE